MQAEEIWMISGCSLRLSETRMLAGLPIRVRGISVIRTPVLFAQWTGEETVVAAVCQRSWYDANSGGCATCGVETSNLRGDRVRRIDAPDA